MAGEGARRQFKVISLKSGGEVFECRELQVHSIQMEPLFLLLVHCFFERLTSGELHCCCSSDFDFFASLWVTAGTSSALACGERTEANQLHCVALGNCLDDVFNNGVQRTLCSSLRDFSISSDCVDQFRFVHFKIPFTVKVPRF